MPLTARGKKALRKFQKEYGKKKGKQVFYAYMKKHKKKTKDWHNVDKYLKSNSFKKLLK